MQDDSAKYVCDADSFRVANEMERNLNLGCVSYTIGALQDSAFSKFAYVVYVCSVTGSSYEWKEDSYGYPKVEHDTMIDARDGKSYKIVTIGKQTWMAENLNYSDATIDVEDRSSCYEGFDKNCDKYGRLYTWSTAMDSLAIFSKNGKGCGYQKECSPTYPVRGICPEGWHLPTNEEWNSLYAAMGSNVYAMQARNDKGWNKATDLFGFSAMPTGLFNGSYFEYFGSDGYFWSASYYGYWEYAYHWYMNSSNAYISDSSRRYHFSVRCVKDDSATSN